MGDFCYYASIGNKSLPAFVVRGNYLGAPLYDKCRCSWESKQRIEGIHWALIVVNVNYSDNQNEIPLWLLVC